MKSENKAISSLEARMQNLRNTVERIKADFPDKQIILEQISLDIETEAVFNLIVGNAQVYRLTIPRYLVFNCFTLEYGNTTTYFESYEYEDKKLYLRAEEATVSKIDFSKN